MTKKNKNFIFKDTKSFIFDSLKECKIKTLVLSIIMLITFLTGIIIAIKTRNDFGTTKGLGIINVQTGGLTSTFFTRLLSMILIYLVLFGSSFLPYLFPLAIIFLSYRSYLLGLNVTLIIIFYGFSGAFITILIAFPCQLLALLILEIFYLLMGKTCKDFRCFGGSRIPNQKTKILIISIIALILVCLIESILLALFSPKIILVI